MATRKPMGTGWNIRRGTQKKADKNWDIQDTLGDPPKAVGDVPPPAKYSRVAGSTRTGTTSAILNGRETSPYSPNFKRDIGPEEEGRLISSHWGADKLAAPVAKKSAPPAPVSSAGSPKAGPKPSAAPAVNVRAKATTVATSAPAGHSSTVMHTPTTNAAAGSAPIKAPTGRLTMPSDTSGGDSGVGKTAGGLAAAGVAAAVLRKPLFGAAKLAGRAAKGVAWSIPKAVAGKISQAKAARTPMGKRVASLTSTPSGGAGTGRPTVGAAAQTYGPAHGYKAPGKGAVVQITTPSGKGVAIQTAPATTTATPVATAAPQKGAPIVAPKAAAATPAVAIAPKKPRAPRKGQPVVTTPTGQSVSVSPPSASNAGAPIPTAPSVKPVTVAAPKAAPARGIAIDATPSASSSTSTTPSKPASTGGASEIVLGEDGKPLTGMDRLFALRRRAGMAFNATGVPEAGQPSAEPQEGDTSGEGKGKLTFTKGKWAPPTPPAAPKGQSLEGLGLKAQPTTWGQNAGASTRITTPTGQTVVRRKKAPKVRTVTAESAAASEAARMATRNVDASGVEKPLAPPKPAVEPTKKERIARAVSVKEQHTQRQLDELANTVKRTKAEKGVAVTATKLSDVLPAPIRKGLEAIRAGGVTETATTKVHRETPTGQEDFQSEKQVRAERVQERQAAKRAAMQAETVVGSTTARNAAHDAEVAARKAQVEAHMKTKGFTKVATPTVEDHIAGTKPEAVRVGPGKVKAGKGKKGSGKPPGSGLPRSIALPRATGKPSGRVPKPTAPRGKGVPIKAGGLLGGALLAAGAAREAAAAPSGERGKAVGGFLKESGKGMAKDLAIMGGLAAIPVAGVPLATGYGAYRLAEGIPDTVKNIVGAAKGLAGWGSAAFNAYRERKSSEAKFGEKQYQAAIAKQKKKGLI